MFNFQQFDNTIFSMNRQILWELCNYSNNMAEYFEHTSGRPTFSSSKSLYLTEIQTLNALLPTTKAALIAAMTIIPSDYQDFVADKLLGVK